MLFLALPSWKFPFLFRSPPRPNAHAPAAGGRRGRAGTPTPLWRESFDSLNLYEADAMAAAADPDLIVHDSDQDEDDDGDPFRLSGWMRVGPRPG